MLINCKLKLPFKHDLKGSFILYFFRVSVLPRQISNKPVFFQFASCFFAIPPVFPYLCSLKKRPFNK